MKRINIVLASFALTTLVACGGGETSEPTEKKENDKKEVTEDKEIKDPRYQGDCAKANVDDWDNFLGIEYGTNELDLRPILGEFTGGEYTADSSAFKYYFNRVELAPLTIFVNGKTGKVETIFLEILSKVEFFQRDIDAVKSEFKAEDCDMDFFGMTADEMIDLMGKPDRDKTEKGVRAISYDTDPLKTSVTFRFYPSQGDMCTSISLNWYYKGR